jgi:hypothetical protein
MTEERPEKEEKKKLKRRRKKGVYNVEPAEELVKGPSGEDYYRV